MSKDCKRINISIPDYVTLLFKSRTQILKLITRLILKMIFESPGELGIIIRINSEEPCFVVNPSRKEAYSDID